MCAEAALADSNIAMSLDGTNKKAAFVVVALTNSKSAVSMAKYRRFPALRALDKDAPARNRIRVKANGPSRRGQRYPSRS